MDITNYMKAGYPAIYINTTETDRAIESIHADGYESFAWDCLRGIISPETNRTVEDVIDPLGALQWLSDRQESILIVQNFHHFLGSVEILQAIANNIHIYKGQGSCLIMAGPHLTLPQEIEKYFTVLDFALPSTQDLTGIMQELGEAVGVDINPTAVEAAKQGVRVTLLDENARVGGQIFRQLEKGFTPDVPEAMGKNFQKGKELFKEFKLLENKITYLNSATVWGIFDNNRIAYGRNGE